MRWAWRIGRIAGIDVRVHVTFVLLLVWIAWSYYATTQSVAAAVSGVLFILLVFGIVVLHELGHALTARRFGIRTRHITLLPIGGVAALERMPDNPRHELLVALAGPAVNGVLALVLLVAIAVTGGVLVPVAVMSPSSSILAQLMWINIALALFNLLPAFPMDGGRALRALLAMRMDNVRATQVAATLGQGMALVFGAIGLFVNPLLLFIALFVWLGATAEARLAQIKFAMDGIPVSYAMIPEVRTVQPDEEVSVAVQFVLDGFQQDFPVVHGGQVVGMLTRDGLMRALAERGPGVRVTDAMDTDVKITHPHAMLEDVFSSLQQRERRSLPVVWDDGSLAGLITMDQIAELVLIHSALRERRLAAGAAR